MDLPFNMPTLLLYSLIMKIDKGNPAEMQNYKLASLNRSIFGLIINPVAGKYPS